MIKVGDQIPAATLMEYSEVEGGGCSLGPNPVDVRKASVGKTIALFALPGAFTPTCSAKHVPGYVEKFADLKAAGVDEIWCVSVNDAFVMGAWARDQKTAGKVRMLADGDAVFTKATGLTVDVVEPVPEGARLTWARAAAYAVLDGSSAQEAPDLYARIAGPGAEAPETVARESFGILVAFQRLDAARALGAWLEAHDPADTVRAHELRVLVEPSIDKAPAAYVEALFDGFAERFDHQLVDMLGYEAPALLAELVASHRQQFDRILDLGCGTGLAGPHLKRFGGRLIGVDLSSGMLAKAAERGGYYALVQDEAVAFLESHPGAFDLIVSADVLIYFGELGPLFSAAAAALPTGGLLAVSTELGQDGWTLLPSARYAHGDAYVRASASGFRILERQEIPLRREGADVTVGCLYLLERI